MDLVASYSSDESENETTSFVNPDSINSDVNALQTVSKFKQNINEKGNPKESEPTEIQPVSNKILEDINISDSDSENDTKTLFINSHINQKEKQHCFVNSEKIDFLHLESSDTDDEQHNFQNSVDNLLVTAAILNDIECGPVKPAIDMNHMLQTTSPESFLHEPSNKHDSRTYSGKRADELPETFPKKHFKPNTETEDVKDLDSHFKEENRIPKEFIFRMDDRVMTMHNKRNCRIPTKMTKDFVAHTSVINTLSWCAPQYSHLLLSASSDCSLKVWDIFCKNPVQCFKSTAGLKAAKWMCNGKQIATGGYGKKVHVFDVISGNFFFYF